MPYIEDTTTATATFLINTSQSTRMDVSGRKYFTFLMPAGWQGTQISFLVAATPDQAANTFLPLYDDEGNEVILTVAASRAVVPSKWALVLAAVQAIIIRSGVVGAEVQQTAQRAITVLAEAG